MLLIWTAAALNLQRCPFFPPPLVDPWSGAASPHSFARPGWSPGWANAHDVRAAALGGKIPSSGLRTLGSRDSLFPHLWWIHGHGQHRPCPLHDPAGHRGWAKAHDVRAAALGGKILSLLTQESLDLLPCPVIWPVTHRVVGPRMDGRSAHRYSCCCHSRSIRSLAPTDPHITLHFIPPHNQYRQIHVFLLHSRAFTLLTMSISPRGEGHLRLLSCLCLPNLHA